MTGWPESSAGDDRRCGEDEDWLKMMKMVVVIFKVMSDEGHNLVDTANHPRHQHVFLLPMARSRAKTLSTEAAQSAWRSDITDVIWPHMEG